MTPLIDATEMYLRTVWELEEERITPIRARLVERLNLSPPAVSETVARLEEEGLMRIGADRTLALTDKGREIATSVMRKHRLAELLLTEVIGMDWAHVHNEACRWEHVISDDAEARIAAVLGDPSVCPYGNPIPGATAPPEPVELITMADAAKQGDEVIVQRISERLQVDVDALAFLREHDLLPGMKLALDDDAGNVVVDGGRTRVPPAVAGLVYVSTS
ncbi:MAG TPA: metal-dependent transcriptional regulator [Egibacteraceae bacterium]|jgi:DtxR family transcriptional regulator, Mn-dependent transcriptional regulator|nr:metal-dependent transcriptional regulator [Egibacteraceae bacterium]